jgi:hypothetical protein
MKRLAFVLAATLLLSAPACRAADAGLPLGLEKFHWDMTQAEVGRVLPLHPYTIEPPSKPPPPGTTVFKSDPYAWQSCRFGGRWWFSKTALSAVSLIDDGGTRECAEAILSALYARYGKYKKTSLRRAGDPGSLDTYEWKSAGTDVSFVWLGPLGGSIVRFSKPSQV